MNKRIFDVFFSFLGLLFLFPLFFLIALLIKLDSKGPVFFRQERVGREFSIFKIHKFRTMFVESEKVGGLTVGNDSRITRVGRILRKSKIDELPQLIDVFLGHMSFVGPRPELKEFVDFYPDDIRDIILSVRPGITDLASIEMVDENDILSKYKNPREAYITHIIPIKTRYYVEYAKCNSIFMDIKIIISTFLKIITR